MHPDRKNIPPTAQRAESGGASEDDGWIRRAQAAYFASTTYLDQNLRKGWNDSIAAFNNKHPNDSKYNHPTFDKRSKLFRPKIRSVIRKNEAAAAAAFFSNMDVVDVRPQDQTSRAESSGADVMKALLQYRLSKSIPWYQIVIGGLQDAQVTAACAHLYWEYEEGEPEHVATEMEVAPVDEEFPAQQKLPIGAFAVEDAKEPEAAEPMMIKPGQLPPKMEAPIQQITQMAAQQAAPMAAATGQPVQVLGKSVFKVRPKKDKPCIDLIPVENIRIDPSASWIDPVNTSPYIIHLIPMYTMDVKEKMEIGEWRRYSEGEIKAFGGMENDSTRQARNSNRDDQYSQDGTADDYEVVWIQRHIHRKDGEDWEFYMLGDRAMLTDARPLKESVFHGMRPYVIGSCMLEAHKTFPASIPQLGRGLVDEANEIVNQRIDNIKFVLNKKWFVKRGKDVDIGGLVRNVPGGVVSMDDPVNDVREISWPDVTASAYEEQSRVDSDMNELLGNFSPAQVMADQGLNAPARNMAMLGQSAGTLVEYLLRTYVETFVQPILRQLVKLEQEYETDETVLAIAGKNAQLHVKYGINEVVDSMLDHEMTLTVNVGMGATDPNMKLQKFLAGMNTYIAMMKSGVVGINMQEVGKEIFGHLGYSDGTRFFTTDNPQVQQLQQQVQQMQQLVQALNAKLQDKSQSHLTKAAIAAAGNQTKIDLAKIKEDGQNMRAATTHLRAIAEQDKRQAHDIALRAVGSRG